MILLEGLLNGLMSVWVLARIVIPLMIVLEIARANRWLEKLNRWLHPPFRMLGLSEEGAFPVLVAVIFGLLFGSGLIIANYREGRLNPVEVQTMGGFMAICHAMIEDTVIFAVLGIPLWLLVVPRTSVAILASVLIYRLAAYGLKRSQKRTWTTPRSTF